MISPTHNKVILLILIAFTIITTTQCEPFDIPGIPGAIVSALHSITLPVELPHTTQTSVPTSTKSGSVNTASASSDSSETDGEKLHVF
ncbi:hypothetical protein SBOR_9434 [Sclerotinia borealis F-4128]|uniref:Secreted protein n=1 Tax=Sclerotinia borealis (strain F-4128) TaxID=1432307 RepID=W9C2R2_SCLBF|nr:hypothetical protein SBOR_9434 [Sclerotinia borealis F-4128]